MQVESWCGRHCFQVANVNRFWEVETSYRSLVNCNRNCSVDREGAIPIRCCDWKTSNWNCTAENWWLSGLLVRNGRPPLVTLSSEMIVASGGPIPWVPGIRLLRLDFDCVSDKPEWAMYRQDCYALIQSELFSTLDGQWCSFMIVISNWCFQSLFEYMCGFSVKVSTGYIRKAWRK